VRYSLGACLADYGFNFLEKIHEPIFLINRSGILVKINEAGRKFLRVSHLTEGQLEGFVKSSVLSLFQDINDSYRRIPVGKGLHLIARSFVGSDLVMIELVK
jgi:hypothetical protein